MSDLEKAPERIWISLWEDEDLHPLDQKLNDEDVEYIRADLVEAMVKDAVKEEMRMIGY